MTRPALTANLLVRFLLVGLAAPAFGAIVGWIGYAASPALQNPDYLSTLPWALFPIVLIGIVAVPSIFGIALFIPGCVTWFYMEARICSGRHPGGWEVAVVAALVTAGCLVLYFALHDWIYIDWFAKVGPGTLPATLKHVIYLSACAAIAGAIVSLLVRRLGLLK